MIKDINVGSITDEGYRPVILKNLDRNINVECRYYKTGSKNKASAAIFVGGIGGGWDSPAKGLYSKLSIKLKDNKINSLRIRYRYPSNLEESVIDILAGVEFITQNERISSIALVGHSFGGAVVISAASQVANIIKTIVTLATQSYGAEGISRIREGSCSILLLHGINDNTLPPYCSLYVYKNAKEPKQLVLYDKASHSLDEVSDRVFQKVYSWIVENLSKE